MASSSRRPGATLYNNNDSPPTATGRFTAAPWVDFEATIADADKGIIKVSAYDALRKQKVGTFTFNVLQASLLTANAQGKGAIYPAEEDPTFVLVDTGGTKARWRLERRIQAQTESRGLL